MICGRWECSFNINSTCQRGEDGFIELCDEIDTELTIEIPQRIKELLFNYTLGLTTNHKRV